MTPNVELDTEATPLGRFFRSKEEMTSHPHLHIHWFAPGGGIVDSKTDMVELCCHACHCGIFVMLDAADLKPLDEQAADFFSRHINCVVSFEDLELALPCNPRRRLTHLVDRRMT